ncbi:MAG: glycosyltransferase [Clostridiales bacterium]|nr:glycosyltransferase [Clostridiales bacterium]
MHKLLFLGGVFPKKSREIEENSKGNIQYAANVLQWNIINGITENGITELTVFSAPFIGSWPKRYKKWRIRSRILTNKEHAVEVIPFTNLPVWKNVSRYYSVYKYVKQWIEDNQGDNCRLSIIAYSAHTPFIKALFELKKKYPVHTHLIVPDLPEYMNLSNKTSIAYKILKKMDIAMQRKYLAGIDSFTFLTKYMSDTMNYLNKPYVVVEGMINPSEADTEFYKKEREESKNIVYTGTMNERYGVLKLVEAMKYITDPNVNLILCGDGDSSSKIRKAAQKDHRIQYMGQVSRQQALEIQSGAAILVNPRSNNEEYTKYSFPSKNLEFMLHRKPVLVFKLEGIEDDYDEVLHYFKSNSPEEMASDMMELCCLSKEKRDEIGEKTTSFVLENKNYKKQTKKIIELCEKQSMIRSETIKA